MTNVFGEWDWLSCGSISDDGVAGLDGEDVAYRSKGLRVSTVPLEASPLSANVPRIGAVPPLDSMK